MAANKKDRPGAGRNPFPYEPFYCVPTKLYVCGLGRELTGSEFKRYSTFLRPANYHKRKNFRATLPELAQLDGVSPRRAHEVHPRLQERKLILVERHTNPYTYVVLLPSEWRDANGQPYPPSKMTQSCLWDSRPFSLCGGFGCKPPAVIASKAGCSCCKAFGKSLRTRNL
jgi:hypothetical protein